MTGEDALRRAERVIAPARAAGADEAEVFVEEVAATHVRVFDGAVDSLRTTRSRGFGLRVVVGGRPGYAFAAGDKLGDLADRAVRSAHLTHPDPGSGLPAVVAAAPVPEACQQTMSEVPLEDKIAAALAMERAARAAHPLIVSTEDVEYFDFDRAVAVVSTAGARCLGQQSLAILNATAVAGGVGGCQSGTACSYGRTFAALRPEENGRRAAARAARVANARPIPTAELPVILDPWVAARFVDLLAHAVSAESVRKGRSRLKDRIGDLVASRAITVVDDGRLGAAPFAAPFDAEGVPTRRTAVIGAGRLEGFLFDTYEARAAGRCSTGNAVRASFRDQPVLGRNSFYVAAGDRSPEAILQSTHRGLYVQEIQGMHLANPVSGDFSVGVTGGWIEAGGWVHAVRGVTIAGNLIDLLAGVDAVGRDLQFASPPTVIVACSGSPTLRVSSLVVSGV
jgi:PmbA protein